MSPDLRTHLAELLRRSEAADARARLLVGSLTPAQLGWTPPGGGWSVGQVLEHLVVAADQYLPRMRAAAARAERPTANAIQPWRPSLVGRLLISVVDPQSARRTSAPRAWRPGPAPRAAVLDALLRTQEELRGLLRAADELDPTSTRLASPVSPLVRLTLADAMTVLVLHVERHLAQIERVREAPGFPH